MSKVRWADMTDEDWPDPPPVATVSKHGVKVAPRPPTPAYVPPHLRTDKTKTRVDSNEE